MADEQPLIVTLELDEWTEQRFDAERAERFPPGRTVVGAHVTLFHALPQHVLPDLVATLAAATERGPLTIRVGTPYSLGSGVAYRLESTDLQSLHAAIRSRFATELTRQDAEAFRPHVTVQNKVDPDAARRTLAELTEGFEPFEATGVALELWQYDGGPWSHLERFAFSGTP